jgi:hypothetical protein
MYPTLCPVLGPVLGPALANRSGLPVNNILGCVAEPDIAVAARSRHEGSWPQRTEVRGSRACRNHAVLSSGRSGYGGNRPLIH